MKGKLPDERFSTIKRPETSGTFGIITQISSKNFVLPCARHGPGWMLMSTLVRAISDFVRLEVN
jgi:hypothetical protein